MRKLSEVQIHVGAPADSREMHELRQRISGAEIFEEWSGDRVPE
jgi:hypothetical protein